MGTMSAVVMATAVTICLIGGAKTILLNQLAMKMTFAVSMMTAATSLAAITTTTVGNTTAAIGAIMTMSAVAMATAVTICLIGGAPERMTQPAMKMMFAASIKTAETTMTMS